jgi:hypothetical protein
MRDSSIGYFITCYLLDCVAVVHLWLHLIAYHIWTVVPTAGLCQDCEREPHNLGTRYVHTNDKIVFVTRSVTARRISVIDS